MNHTFKSVLSGIFVGCAAVVLLANWACAAGTTAGGAGERAEMPVSMVVLFSSGVGYFEHSGTVQGNGMTELRFKSDQINDILKSLVLEDLDGGKIGTIAYPSRDPIEKTLRSYQVDITSNPPLADLLNQLRGAPVLVTAHAEQIEGTIVGLEKRRKTLLGQNNQVVDEWMFTILSGAAMRSVWLDEVQKIELREPVLQQELQKALAAVAETRNQDKKPVTINFQGNGNRKVRLRYVIETPIWKTSYRLILPQAKGGKSKLQGWAIVENQTDSDWNNVQLSLVSGRPISFIEDLYKPIYISRPVVEPELYKGLRPQSYESGIALPAPAAPEMAMAAPPMMERAQGAGAAPRGRSMSKSIKPDFGADASVGEGGGAFNATSSVVAAATAEKLGDLFQYTVGSVSLPRSRSAMFPILTEDVTAERISIFNTEVMPRNPLRGVLLRNSTDKHVMQGPVTVFDGNTYAGDAQVGNLPPGQEKLLSYALDLEVQVDATKNRQESLVQTASLLKGVLKVSRKDVYSQEYVIQNKSDSDRSLVIEHRFRPGWKLAGLQPSETTATHYRLKQAVPKGKTETMTVVEENVRDESVAILPASIGSLELYARTDKIPKNVRDTLGKAIALKQALEDSERRLADKHNTLEEIEKEQERIRSNMGAVNNSSQYYSRLLEKLNSQETEIEKIQGEVRALEKKVDDQRTELEKYLANLSY
ncbi:MAG: hypothetical protein ABFD97_13990 [Syntrophobacter sp.]